MFSTSNVRTDEVGLMKLPKVIAVADEFEISMFEICEFMPKLKSILLILKIEPEIAIKVLLLKVMLPTVPVVNNDVELLLDT